MSRSLANTFLRSLVDTLDILDIAVHELPHFHIAARLHKSTAIMQQVIREAYSHFYKLAEPTWTQLVEAADLTLEQSGSHRTDGRRRQFSVGIADRAQLDALAAALELPRSKVINLALDELAGEMDQRTDFYADLFAESCQRAADYLFDEYNITGEEAVAVAARAGERFFPERKVWLQILKGEVRPHPGRGPRVQYLAADGSDADPDGKKALLWDHFEDRLIELFDGRFEWYVERWIEAKREHPRHSS